VLVVSHRLFDEMVSIPQSSRTMRLLISWLFLATTSIAAWAQTNVPPNVRQLSLQDCIEMALRHNLDLQIERYVPKIALYNLRGAYGGYDPTFSLSGQHDHYESGSRFSNGLTIPGSVTDDDSFNSSLSGLSPIGTTYSLQGNAVDTYGTSAGSVVNRSSGSASVKQWV